MAGYTSFRLSQLARGHTQKGLLLVFIASVGWQKDRSPIEINNNLQLFEACWSER